MTVVFLSEAERERLNSFPSDIPPDDLTSFFTLTDADKQQLPIKSSSANRLGFALQLCTLRYLGFCPDTVAPAPLPAVIYVASQLGVSAHALASYGERSQTRTAHLQAIQAYLGFRKAGAADVAALVSWLLERALEHDKPAVLLELACDHLRTRRLLRPGLTTLEKLVVRARTHAAGSIFRELSPLLTDAHRAVLDSLLLPDSTTNRTPLGWLRRRATANSAPAILEELKKLAFLRMHDVEAWDVSGLSPNRVKRLAQLGRKSTNQMLQRMTPERRYPILVAFLTETIMDITDDIIEMFDRCFMETYARARRNLDEFRKLTGRSTNEKVVTPGKLCTLLTDPETTASPDLLYKRLYTSFSVADLQSIAEECDAIARPLDDNYFD